LKRPFDLDGGLSVHISSSTGVALYPEHGVDEATLSRHADVAMYCAKAAGRDQYVVYNPSLDETVAADLADPPR
jgi:GGDEF domain-containing protein